MKAYLSSIRNQDAKARISMAMMIAPMTMRTVRLTMGNGRGDGTNIRYSCTVRTSIKVKPRNLRRLISVTRTPVRSGKVVKCRCTACQGRDGGSGDARAGLAGGHAEQGANGDQRDANRQIGAAVGMDSQLRLASL